MNSTPQQQTITHDQRQHWLAHRAGDWIWIVGYCSRLQRNGKPDQLAIVEVHMFGAHMVTLALQHLHECLEHLRRSVQFTPATKVAVDAFRQTYRSSNVTQLRHALEHEEDRIAGHALGRGAKRKYDGPYPDPIITGFKTGAALVTAIRVLNTDYDLTDVIEAALALEAPMSELSNSLWH